MQDVGQPELRNYKSCDFGEVMLHKISLEIGLHEIELCHTIVIPAGIINLAQATADHLNIIILYISFFM